MIISIIVKEKRTSVICKNQYDRYHGIDTSRFIVVLKMFNFREGVS